MGVIGVRQKARLFLEGREVPIKSALISSRVGAPSTAVINVVPLTNIKKIVPRSQVHIFLRDSKNFPDNDYRLAFEGEVIGRAYGKSQADRFTQFVCMDYSSYWDRAKIYVMSPNFVLGKVADIVSLEDQSIATTQRSLGGQTLTTSATANTRIIEILLANNNKDLAKGVVNVIQKLAGANQFYSAAFERLRIFDRVAVFSGNKVQSFLNDLKIDEFLRDYTGKFGGITDLRSLLYSVMGMVFHDFISVPFPAAIFGRPIPGGFATQTNDPNHAPVSAPGSKGSTSTTLISQFMFVPDGYTLPAPLCNVIFPNQQSGFTFQEDFMASPTRYSFRASMPTMMTQQSTSPQYSTQFYPPAFSDFMFGKHTISDTEKASLLGPSTLITDPKTGNTYASIFYNNSNSKAVGSALGTVLREADYMSNEESLKGVLLETDTFMPSYTALIKGASGAARTAFIQSVGAYQFFKKRFASRNTTAQILFHPFLVPGFNTIILDESDAGQSFIAKLQSVTHVLQDDGCTTQVELAYGRDFDEIDLLTGDSSEPPTPAWFDSSIFGISGSTQYKGKSAVQYFQEETDYLQKIGAISADEVKVRGKIKNPTVFPNISIFFQSLLGCKATTDYNPQTNLKTKVTPPLPKLVSNRGAVSWLVFQYQQVVTNTDARDNKVQSLIARPLVSILDAFAFDRAQPVGFKNDGKFKLPEEFAVFTGISSGSLPGRFDGQAPGGKPYADQGVIALRRSIIDPYVTQLKQSRGFRG